MLCITGWGAIQNLRVEGLTCPNRSLLFSDVIQKSQRLLCHCSDLEGYWLYLIVRGQFGLSYNWNSILNYSFFFSGVSLVSFNWWNCQILLKNIDGRCSYRETWFPLLSWGVFCIPLFLLAEQKSKHDTIYLFSETWRGYREAEYSDGSFLNAWFPYLTITFQCFSCGSKVSYRKALVCLHKELSLC